MQQDQIWFQFMGSLNGFQPVPCLCDHAKLQPGLQHRANVLSPRRKIIHYQNPHRGTRNISFRLGHLFGITECRLISQGNRRAEGL